MKREVFGDVRLLAEHTELMNPVVAPPVALPRHRRPRFAVPQRAGVRGELTNADGPRARIRLQRYCCKRFRPRRIGVRGRGRVPHHRGYE